MMNYPATVWLSDGRVVSYMQRSGSLNAAIQSVENEWRHIGIEKLEVWPSDDWRKSAASK